MALWAQGSVTDSWLGGIGFVEIPMQFNLRRKGLGYDFERQEN
jgi:hypothetical protein